MKNYDETDKMLESSREFILAKSMTIVHHFDIISYLIDVLGLCHNFVFIVFVNRYFKNLTIAVFL